MTNNLQDRLADTYARTHENGYKISRTLPDGRTEDIYCCNYKAANDYIMAAGLTNYQLTKIGV